MKPFEFRSIAAIAAMALLSGCGGPAEDAADSAPVAAAPVVSANVPLADCEAEGCNRPRIIDGLAEQYRADAAMQQALAAEPVPAAALPAALPAPAPASEVAPAVPVPLQAPAVN